MAFAAAVIWTIGPWMPSIACAAGELAQALQARAMPDCHRVTGDDADAERSGARDCCKDVADSCCLEGASVTSTLSAGKSLDPPQQAITLPALAPSVAGFPALSGTVLLLARPPDPAKHAPLISLRL